MPLASPLPSLGCALIFDQGHTGTRDGPAAARRPRLADRGLAVSVVCQQPRSRVLHRLWTIWMFTIVGVLAAARRRSAAFPWVTDPRTDR